MIDMGNKLNKEIALTAEFEFIRELEARIVRNNNMIVGYEKSDPDYSHIDASLYVTYCYENRAIRVALVGLYQQINKETGVRDDQFGRV